MSPLFDADFVIKFHAFSACFAILLLFIVLAMRKGTKFHKIAGRLWVVGMLSTALSSFFIHDIRQFLGFSWIHLLSIYVLCSCFIGIWYIRNGNVKAHRKTMYGMAIGGLGIAGAFTLMPGRIMYEVFFGL